MKRSAGILMPITSLPSPYGVGTMGKCARDFTEYLNKAGQSYWQVLPIGPTGYGDSPYQAFSSFAGNPYLIDLDELKEEGLLECGEYESLEWGEDPERVDYGKLYENRTKVLAIAVSRLERNEEYVKFLEDEKDWLNDYALFMALKNENNGVAFTQWPEKIRTRDTEEMEAAKDRLSKQINFYEGVQYLFFTQWKKMKAYANEHGVRIIGDVPIYVSPDSADLWSHPELFLVDENGCSKEIAGCPPDGFSATGQLWGNPLFDWAKMKEDGYAWWIERIRHQMELVDVLRIDHFRGFESFYSIPYGSTDACGGHWNKGPGAELFACVEKKLGHLNIIAEDLGFLTPEVIEMVKETGYPGMKVIQLAFDERDTGSGYLPHQYTNNCVVYAGTHDNDTFLGWYDTCNPKYRENCRKYFNLTKEEGYNWGVIRGAYESVADLAILQLQDVLGIGTEGRINTPSTTGNNWTWRVKANACTDETAARLNEWAKITGRLPE